jgi:hypothetical protein
MHELKVRDLIASNKGVVFALLFSVYLLLILYPILRADRYCNDDLIRALLGNYGWNNNGRHLTSLVMRALEFNSQRLMDISPLPQIAAIGVFAWIGVLLARHYEIKSAWLVVLLTLPLGGQPFYLENLSYKFDAFCMALAVLCALLPIVSIPSNGKGWALGILSLLASLNFYQPAINVFLIFVMLEVLVRQVEGDGLAGQIKRLASRAAQFVIAMVVYQWLISASLKGWMKVHGAVIRDLNQWGQVQANAFDFYRFLADAFNPRWTAIFVPLAVLAIAIPMLASAHHAFSDRHRRSAWQTGILLLLALLLPCAALLCIAGPMLLLEQPILMPRVMIGVGALLTAALIAMHVVLRKWPAMLRLQFVVAGIWALGCVVFANAYGNAAAAQKQYETRIAIELARDLADLRASHPVRNYLVSGSAEWAPMTARMVDQHPLLRTLVLPYLRESDFNSRNFLRFHLQDMPDFETETNSGAEPVFARACSFPVLNTRSAYTLKLVDETALIDFSKMLAKSCP